MKKLFKDNIKVITAFLLGIIVTSGTVFAVSTITDSSEITFDNTGTTLQSTTVEDAIKELTTKLGSGGGLKLVTSGTGARTNGTVTVTPNVPKTLNNYIITMSELPAIGTASYAYNSSLILFGTAQPFMYLGEGYGFTGCSASSFNFRWNSNGTFNYYVYEINEE